MRKVLLIIATIALLGMLAAYINPLGPEKQAAINKPTTGTSEATTAEPAPTNAEQPGSSGPVNQPQVAQTAGYQDGTYQGGDYSSRYGDVQISVAIRGGKISGITFDRLTAYDRRSAEINNSAAPLLKDQTLSAQSADIDGVSGATYTSSDYVRSLQSALDKARM